MKFKKYGYKILLKKFNLSENENLYKLHNNIKWIGED